MNLLTVFAKENKTHSKYVKTLAYFQSLSLLKQINYRPANECCFPKNQFWTNEYSLCTLDLHSNYIIRQSCPLGTIVCNARGFEYTSEHT